MFRHEGFTEFIPKPIERAVLERVLRKVLPKRCIQYNTAPASSSNIQQPSDSVPDPTETKEAPQTMASVPDTSMPEDTSVGESSAVSFDPLEQIGINVQLGLDYCCGDDDFYLEMLRTFRSQGAAKMLEQAGKKNDTDYIRQNHLQLLDLYDETCKCIAAL